MENMLCFSLSLLATLFASVTPSLFDQAKMMSVVLGVNPFGYVGYGCYCGPGTGHITVPPVDGIDSCCYHHDHCYDNIKKVCVSLEMLYFTNYTWTFDRTTKEIKCTPRESGKCARALCECDVRGAKCFAYYTRLRGEKKKCTTNAYAKRWTQTKNRPFEPWHNQSLYKYYMTSGKYRLP